MIRFGAILGPEREYPSWVHWSRFQRLFPAAMPGSMPNHRLVQPGVWLLRDQRKSSCCRNLAFVKRRSSRKQTTLRRRHRSGYWAPRAPGSCSMSQPPRVAGAFWGAPPTIPRVTVAMDKYPGRNSPRRFRDSKCFPAAPAARPPIPPVRPVAFGRSTNRAITFVTLRRLSPIVIQKRISKPVLQAERALWRYPESRAIFSRHETG